LQHPVLSAIPREGSSRSEAVMVMVTAAIWVGVVVVIIMDGVEAEAIITDGGTTGTEHVGNLKGPRQIAGLFRPT
jgi:hypothetical protein